MALDPRYLLLMPKTVTLRVQPKFRDEYGELVTVSPVQATILARKGVVNLSDRTIYTRELIPESPQPEDPPKRRRGRPRKNSTTPDTEDRHYLRRDLVAED